jgi:hypothetical protein
MDRREFRCDDHLVVGGGRIVVGAELNRELRQPIELGREHVAVARIARVSVWAGEREREGEGERGRERENDVISHKKTR